MDNKSEPILSICIPTYNRCDKLNISLNNILLSASSFGDKVEIIVSDNASQDSTAEVIKRLKTQHPMLKAFRNDQNLGFNRNFFLLSDRYANGQYLWVIGDDDFIDQNAVGIVLDILEKKKDIEFIGLNFRLLPFNQNFSSFSNLQINYPKILFGTMECIIDMQSRSENILSTFTSCFIVKRKVLSEFDKSHFSVDTWQNFQSVFPHTYMIAKSIIPTAPAAYIKTPLMSVCIHPKAWDAKLTELFLKRIIEEYNHFKRCGYTHLRQSHKIIIKSGLYFLFKKQTPMGLRKYFLQFACLSYEFYTCLISSIFKKLTR